MMAHEKCKKYYPARTQKKFIETQNHTLHWCNIKKHIFPRKCLLCCEIKILNSKKYHEKLNITRSSIKNKLIEITKEFELFKFQQNLRIEFAKYYEVFKNKIFEKYFFLLFKR